MGTGPPSKPVSPSRPFDRHPHNRRSCFVGTFLLGSGKSKGKYGNRKSSTMIQLILLQDWQRVLIRSTMFPHEISEPTIIKINDHEWKVFPLHLACALQPPPKVISMLLQYHATASSVPLVLQCHTPKYQWPRLKRLGSFRNLSLKKLPADDYKELLPHGTTRDHRRSFLPAINGDDISIVTTSTVDDAIPRKMYFYSHEGSVVSLEESIGDAGPGDDASASCGTWACDDKASVLLETSLCSFLGRRGVALQLSPSGGIHPLAIPVQLSKETASTADGESNVLLRCRDFPVSQMMEAADAKTILPIHIACLYRACPKVIQLLLREYPMGALSATMGMLPIHLVSAGWSLDPLTTSDGISDEYVLEPDYVHFDASCTLQSLAETSPESLFAKSGTHALTPLEYVKEVMADEKSRESCLDVLQQALHDYDNTNHGGDKKCGSSSSDTTVSSSTCSVVPSIMSEIQYGLLERDGSNPASITTTRPRPKLFNFLLQRNWQAAMDLIELDPNLAKEWHYGIDSSDGYDLGGSDSNVNDGEPEMGQKQPILWKRLALHAACSVCAPIGLVQLLIKIYPEATTSPDPHNGSLPIHLACSTFNGRGSTCSGDSVLSSSPPIFSLSLPLIQELIAQEPGTTKAVDDHGRSPLHCAILSKAAIPIVKWLVQHDRASVVCPDLHGKTPLQYANRVYANDSPIMRLLDTVWI